MDSTLTVGSKTIEMPAQIVARPALKPLNPMEDKQSYSQVESNGSIVTKPSVLHFAGFKLNHAHEMKLKLVNTTGKKQRFHILPAQTPFFKLKFDKQGDVRPGLSQEVSVVFHPQEHKYYYDSVRIHSAAGNLVVPIHAYPVVANVDFPSRLDFGAVKAGESVERSLQLGCDVPISFEFQIDVVSSCPDFEISPTSGVIPAEGTVPIFARFTPSRMTTSTMRVQLSLSQFDFKPLLCEMVGSCTPGEPAMRIASPVAATKSRKALMTTIHDTVRGSASKAGNQRQSSTLDMSVSKFNLHDSIEDEEEIVDGIRIPKEIDNWAASQYILTQVPGKLRPSELRASLAAQGHVTAEQTKTDPKSKANAAVNALAEKGYAIKDVVEEWGDGLGKQAMDVFWQRELDVRIEYDRAKSVKAFEAIGAPPVTDEEIADVADRRERRCLELASRDRALERAVSETRPSDLPVCYSVQTVPKESPTFDPYLNDAWRVRKMAMAKFVQHVRTVVTRLRVDRRLEMIGELGRVGTAGSSKSTATQPAALTQAAQRIVQHKVVEQALPVYREENFRDRMPVQAKACVTFEDWNVLPVKVPLQYKLDGMQKQPLPAYPGYLSTENDRAFRKGAEDEFIKRAPRGPDEIPAVLKSGLPQPCTTAPPLPFEVPVPALDDQDQTKLFARGCQAFQGTVEYALRPRDVSDCAGPSPAPGLGAWKSMQDIPLPSRTYTERLSEANCLVCDLPEMLNGPQEEDLSLIAPPGEDDEDEAPNGLPVPPTLDWVKSHFWLPPGESDLGEAEQDSAQAEKKAAHQQHPWVQATSSWELEQRHAMQERASGLPDFFNAYDSKLKNNYYAINWPDVANLYGNELSDGQAENQSEKDT